MRGRERALEGMDHPETWQEMVAVLTNTAEDAYRRGLAARALGAAVTNDPRLRPALRVNDAVTRSLAELAAMSGHAQGEAGDGASPSISARKISLNSMATLHLLLADESAGSRRSWTKRTLSLSSPLLRMPSEPPREPTPPSPPSPPSPSRRGEFEFAATGPVGLGRRHEAQGAGDPFAATYTHGAQGHAHAGNPYSHAGNPYSRESPAAAGTPGMPASGRGRNDKASVGGSSPAGQRRQPRARGGGGRGAGTGSGVGSRAGSGSDFVGAGNGIAALRPRNLSGKGKGVVRRRGDTQSLLNLASRTVHSRHGTAATRQAVASQTIPRLRNATGLEGRFSEVMKLPEGGKLALARYPQDAPDFVGNGPVEPPAWAWDSQDRGAPSPASSRRRKSPHPSASAYESSAELGSRSSHTRAGIYSAAVGGGGLGGGRRDAHSALKSASEGLDPVSLARSIKLPRTQPTAAELMSDSAWVRGQQPKTRRSAGMIVGDSLPSRTTPLGGSSKGGINTPKAKAKSAAGAGSGLGYNVPVTWFPGMGAERGGGDGGGGRSGGVEPLSRLGMPDMTVRQLSEAEDNTNGVPSEHDEMRRGGSPSAVYERGSTPLGGIGEECGGISGVDRGGGISGEDTVGLDTRPRQSRSRGGSRTAASADDEATFWDQLPPTDDGLIADETALALNDPENAQRHRAYRGGYDGALQPGEEAVEDVGPLFSGRSAAPPGPSAVLHSMATPSPVSTHFFSGIQVAHLWRMLRVRANVDDAGPVGQWQRMYVRREDEGGSLSFYYNLESGICQWDEPAVDHAGEFKYEPSSTTAGGGDIIDIKTQSDEGENRSVVANINDASRDPHRLDWDAWDPVVSPDGSVLFLVDWGSGQVAFDCVDGMFSSRVSRDACPPTDPATWYVLQSTSLGAAVMESAMPQHRVHLWRFLCRQAESGAVRGPWQIMSIETMAVGRDGRRVVQNFYVHLTNTAFQWHPPPAFMASRPEPVLELGRGMVLVGRPAIVQHAWQESTTDHIKAPSFNPFMHGDDPTTLRRSAIEPDLGGGASGTLLALSPLIDKASWQAITSPSGVVLFEYNWASAESLWIDANAAAVGPALEDPPCVGATDDTTQRDVAMYQAGGRITGGGLPGASEAGRRRLFWQAHQRALLQWHRHRLRLEDLGDPYGFVDRGSDQVGDTDQLALARNPRQDGEDSPRGSDAPSISRALVSHDGGAARRRAARWAASDAVRAARQQPLSSLSRHLLLAPGKLKRYARRIATLRYEEKDISLAQTRRMDMLRRSMPLDFLYTQLGRFGAEPAMVKERLAAPLWALFQLFERQALSSALEHWWAQTRRCRGVEFRQGCAARLLKEMLLMMAHELKARGFGRWLIVTSVGIHMERSRASRTIQRVYRGFVHRIYFFEILRRWLAVVPLQSVWRMYALRCKWHVVRLSVVRTQAVVRGRVHRRRLLLLRSTIVALQAAYRRHFWRAWFIRVQQSTQTLQHNWRAWLGRARWCVFANIRLQRLQLELTAALGIQVIWRGQFGRKRVHFMRKLLVKQEHAAITLQRAWYIHQGEYSTFILMRCLQVSDLIDKERRLIAQEAERIREGVVMSRISQGWLGRRNMKIRRRYKAAALHVQRLYRGQAARRWYASFLVNSGASAAIAQWWRGRSAHLNHHAVLIQSKWLNCVPGRLERHRATRIERMKVLFLEQARRRFQRASVVVQAFVRMVLAEKRMREERAAVVAQSFIRMALGKFARRRALAARRNAVATMYVDRAVEVGTLQAVTVLRARERKAIILVQTRFRTWFSMHRVEAKREELKRQTAAALVLQRVWRSCAARRLAAMLAESAERIRLNAYANSGDVRDVISTLHIDVANVYNPADAMAGMGAATCLKRLGLGKYGPALVRIIRLKFPEDGDQHMWKDISLASRIAQIDTVRSAPKTGAVGGDRRGSVSGGRRGSVSGGRRGSVSSGDRRGSVSEERRGSVRPGRRGSSVGTTADHVGPVQVAEVLKNVFAALNVANGGLVSANALIGTLENASSPAFALVRACRALAPLLAAPMIILENLDVQHDEDGDPMMSFESLTAFCVQRFSITESKLPASKSAGRRRGAVSRTLIPFYSLPAPPQAHDIHRLRDLDDGDLVKAALTGEAGVAAANRLQSMIAGDGPTRERFMLVKDRSHIKAAFKAMFPNHGTKAAHFAKEIPVNARGISEWELSSYLENHRGRARDAKACVETHLLGVPSWEGTDLKKTEVFWDNFRLRRSFESHLMACERIFALLGGEGAWAADISALIAKTSAEWHWRREIFASEERCKLYPCSPTLPEAATMASGVRRLAKQIAALSSLDLATRRVQNAYRCHASRLILSKSRELAFISRVTRAYHAESHGHSCGYPGCEGCNRPAMVADSDRRRENEERRAAEAAERLAELMAELGLTLRFGWEEEWDEANEVPFWFRTAPTDGAEADDSDTSTYERPIYSYDEFHAAIMVQRLLRGHLGRRMLTVQRNAMVRHREIEQKRAWFIETRPARDRYFSIKIDLSGVVDKDGAETATLVRPLLRNGPNSAIEPRSGKMTRPTPTTTAQRIVEEQARLTHFTGLLTKFKTWPWEARAGDGRNYYVRPDTSETSWEATETAAGANLRSYLRRRVQRQFERCGALTQAAKGERVVQEAEDARKRAAKCNLNSWCVHERAHRGGCRRAARGKTNSVASESGGNGAAPGLECAWRKKQCMLGGAHEGRCRRLDGALSLFPTTGRHCKGHAWCTLVTGHRGAHKLAPRGIQVDTGVGIGTLESCRNRAAPIPIAQRRVAEDKLVRAAVLKCWPVVAKKKIMPNLTNVRDVKLVDLQMIFVHLKKVMKDRAPFPNAPSVAAAMRYVADVWVRHTLPHDDWVQPRAGIAGTFGRHGAKWTTNHAMCGVRLGHGGMVSHSGTANARHLCFIAKDALTVPPQATQQIEPVLAHADVAIVYTHVEIPFGWEAHERLDGQTMYLNGLTGEQAWNRPEYSLDDHMFARTIQLGWRGHTARGEFLKMLARSSVADIVRAGVREAGRTGWLGYKTEGMTGAMWLTRLGLASLVPLLAVTRVDRTGRKVAALTSTGEPKFLTVRDVCKLDDSGLTKLGVAKAPHRRRILGAVAALDLLCCGSVAQIPLRGRPSSRSSSRPGSRGRRPSSPAVGLGGLEAPPARSSSRGRKGRRPPSSSAAGGSETPLARSGSRGRGGRRPSSSAAGDLDALRSSTGTPPGDEEARGEIGTVDEGGKLVDLTAEFGAVPDSTIARKMYLEAYPGQERRADSFQVSVESTSRPITYLMLYAYFTSYPKRAKLAQDNAHELVDANSASTEEEERAAYGVLRRVAVTAHSRLAKLHLYGLCARVEAAQALADRIEREPMTKGADSALPMSAMATPEHKTTPCHQCQTTTTCYHDASEQFDADGDGKIDEHEEGGFYCEACWTGVYGAPPEKGEARGNAAAAAKQLLPESPGPWMGRRTFPTTLQAASVLRAGLEWIFMFERAAMFVQRQYRLRLMLLRGRRERIRIFNMYASIQAAYRGRRDRRVAAELRLLRDTVWEELWSKEYDEVYFFNTRTRESVWTKPADVPVRPLGWWPPLVQPRLARPGFCSECFTETATHLCNECVRERAHQPGVHTRAPKAAKLGFCFKCYVHYHGQERDRQSHTHTVVAPLRAKPLVCIECDGFAAVRCRDCEDSFCKACFKRLHKKGKRAKHSWYGFRVGAPVCIECEVEIAVRRCVQCADAYCVACAERTHKSVRKAKHEMVLHCEELQDGQSAYCTACEVRAAVVDCPKCGEPFCDSCLANEHKKCGYDDDPFAAPTCVECSNLATRECLTCEDAFCGRKWPGHPGCFEVVHAKGKRRTHVCSNYDDDGDDDEKEDEGVGGEAVGEAAYGYEEEEEGGQEAGWAGEGEWEDGGEGGWGEEKSPAEEVEYT